jgi:ubiquinone/menaquinone biosynthesis C-methylase UbiE
MALTLVVVRDVVSTAALLVVAVLGLSILVFQLMTGVPPLSSNATERADVVALLKKAGLSEGAVVYELGSGWGSLAIALAQAFPTAQIRGVEISPLPYWIARFRTRNLPNVRLRRADFFNCDLSDAQAVTCYLMTGPMPRIAQLLDRHLRAGTPVVSLCFWFRDRKVSASVKSSGVLGAAALYHWPAAGEATS